MVIGGCLQEAIVRTVGLSGPTLADGNIIRGPATLSVVCSSAGNSRPGFFTALLSSACVRIQRPGLCR